MIPISKTDTGQEPVAHIAMFEQQWQEEISRAW